MKIILLREWPLFKDALLIASSLPLSVLFPLLVIEWTLGADATPEEKVTFRF